MLITVKRIIFVQNEDELDTLASTSHYSLETRDFIKTKRGTWVDEHQDIVIYHPIMWASVQEIEPDESLQILPYGILLFDVLLHEIFHAFQYNPLLRMHLAGKSQEEIEDEAGRYVENHLGAMLKELGITG